MKKRIVWLFTALFLTLCLSFPALGAGSVQWDSFSPEAVTEGELQILGYENLKLATYTAVYGEVELTLSYCEGDDGFIIPSMFTFKSGEVEFERLIVIAKDTRYTVGLAANSFEINEVTAPLLSAMRSADGIEVVLISAGRQSTFALSGDQYAKGLKAVVEQFYAAGIVDVSIANGLTGFMYQMGMLPYQEEPVK